MRTLRIVISIILILVSLGLLAFSAAFLFNAFPRDTASKAQDTTQEVPDTPADEPETAEESPAPAPSQPEPEPEEEPAAEEPSEPDTTDTDDAAAYIQEYLAAMTTEEKVWQLFITTPEGLTGVTTATQAGETTRAALAERPVGGICYFAANLVDRTQTMAMLDNTQSYAKTPLFLGVDEEGGRVSRAGSNEAMGVTHFEAAATYGTRADMAEVYQVGSTLASELGALGFNLDFAPVADVVTNPNNTEIGDRAYSDDPQVAAAMVSAMVDGLQRGGMVSCLKHFPATAAPRPTPIRESPSPTARWRSLKAASGSPSRRALTRARPW